MRLLLALALLGVAADPAAARPGDVDRGFGEGGGIAYAFGTFPRFDGLGHGIVERVDGRLAVIAQTGVVQLRRSGSPDPRFGDRGGAWIGGNEDPARVAAGALDRRGRTVLVLDRLFEDDSRLALLRLRRDGRPDAAFGPDGRRALRLRGGEPTVNGAAVDRRNRLVLTGHARFGGVHRVVVTRLRPGGAPDRGFGHRGSVVGPHGFSSGPAILRRGRILAPALVAATRRAGRRVALLAYRESGRRLRAYGRRGRALLVARGRWFAEGTRFAAGPRGTVIATGKVRGGPAADRAGAFLARLRSGGRIDRRFGDRGLARLQVARRDLYPAAVAVDAQGRALIAANDEFPYRVLVLRLRPGGRPDRRFGRRGAVDLMLGGRPGFAIIASEASGITVARNGRILVSGTAYDANTGIRDEYGSPYVAVTALRGR